MTESMNLALGANFDLLKTNLAAIFEKDEKGSKTLLTRPRSTLRLPLRWVR